MQIGNRILSLKSLVNWCSNLYFGYLPTYINLGTNYRIGSSKNQIGSDWIFGWESPNFGNLSSNSYNTNQNSSVSFDACHNRSQSNFEVSFFQFTEFFYETFNLGIWDWKHGKISHGIVDIWSFKCESLTLQPFSPLCSPNASRSAYVPHRLI